MISHFPCSKFALRLVRLSNGHHFGAKMAKSAHLLARKSTLFVPPLSNGATCICERITETENIEYTAANSFSPLKGSEEEKTYFRTSDKDRKGMLEKRSPSQSETDEAPERAKRLSNIPFPSLSDVPIEKRTQIAVAAKTIG